MDLFCLAFTIDLNYKGDWRDLIFPIPKDNFVVVVEAFSGTFLSIMEGKRWGSIRFIITKKEY